VQLVDARNGFQIWSERYDRQMEDIFEVQDEIASAIAERLKVTLSSVVKPSTRNLEAYELYLKGRYYWHQRTPAAVRLAIQWFPSRPSSSMPSTRSRMRDSSDCYAILRVYGWVSAEDGRPPAQAAMDARDGLGARAIEVNFSRAFFAFYFEREWRERGTLPERHRSSIRALRLQRLTTGCFWRRTARGGGLGELDPGPARWIRCRRRSTAFPR